MPAVVLLDANVLFPITLTDLLLRIAEINLFVPAWSAVIHEEWMRNLLKVRSDLTREKLERRRRAMDQAFPHSTVSGYETLIDTLTLPDPDDRHILAAAIHTQANEIVTFNLNDFPSDVLSAYNLTATHPDAFLARLLRSYPVTARPIIEQFMNQSSSMEERLANLGLDETLTACRDLLASTPEA